MVRDAFFAGPDEHPPPARGGSERGSERGRGGSRGGFRGAPRGRGAASSRGQGHERGRGRGRGRGGFSDSRGRGSGSFAHSRGTGSSRGSRGGSRGAPRGRGGSSSSSFSPRVPAERAQGESDPEDARPAKRVRQGPKSRPVAKHVAKASPEEEEEPVSIFDKDALDLSSHPLPAFDDLVGTLAQFKRLRKLNAGSIEPSEEHPKGLDSLAWLQKAVLKSKSAARKAAKEEGADPTARDLWFGHHVTTLTLSGNHALGDAHAEHGEEVFSALTAFPTLFALDLSNTSLRALPLLALQTSLKALVLTGNELTVLPTLPLLPNLNTLIVSKNKLTALPSTLPSSLPSLKKLSLANNELVDGASLPDFTLCGDLREVRLNGNPKLASLPPHLSSWGSGRNGTAPGLDVLDLGRCGFRTWESLQPILQPATEGKHRGLRNLNLHGNPLFDLDDPAELEDARARILAAQPALRTLNNTHVGPTKKGESRDPSGPAATEAEDEPVPAPPAAAAGQKRKREEAQQAAASAPAPTPASVKKEQEKEHGKHKRGARGGKKKKQADAAQDEAESAPEPEQEREVQPEPEPEVEEDVHSDSEDEAEATQRKKARDALASAVALDADESDDEAGGGGVQGLAESYLVEDMAAKTRRKARKEWVDKTFEHPNKKTRAQGKKPPKKKGPTNFLAESKETKPTPEAKRPEETSKTDEPVSTEDRSAVVGVVSVDKKIKKRKDASNGAPKPRPAAPAQFGLGGGDAWGGGQSSW